MGLLRIMDSHGDTQVAWEPTDTESLDRARRMVEDAFAEGRGVFVLDEDGTAVRARSFDPNAREMVVIPHIKGG